MGISLHSRGKMYMRLRKKKLMWWMNLRPHLSTAIVCSDIYRICMKREACTAFSMETCCITGVCHWMKVEILMGCGLAMKFIRGNTISIMPTKWHDGRIFTAKTRMPWISCGFCGADANHRFAGAILRPLRECLWPTRVRGLRKAIHITAIMKKSGPAIWSCVSLVCIPNIRTLSMDIRR